MQQRPIGNRTVSAIGLGEMPLSIEGRPDRQQAIATIHVSLDVGVTIIDTADAYSLNTREHGHGEALVAEALAAYGGATDDVLVATKGGHRRPGDGSWTVHGDPAYLKDACEASLKALGVDAIGLYQYHRPDPKVPWAESVGALADLLDEGKILMAGSRTPRWSRSTRRSASSGAGWPASRTNSPRFRSSEGELEHCEKLGIAFIPWSPLGGIGRADGIERSHRGFADVAAEVGATPQQVTLAWMLAKGSRVIPIPGSSRPETAVASAAAAASPSRQSRWPASTPPDGGRAEQKGSPPCCTGVVAGGAPAPTQKEIAMPAVTVPDTMVLPRIEPSPEDLAAIRPVRSVTDAPSGLEGEGFPVRRAFAGVDLADLDPFIHMDQMGEVEYAPGEPKGTPWHPHRGFETVTYMIDGTFPAPGLHRRGRPHHERLDKMDDRGVQGILHIERPTEQLIASGGLFNGIQLWVNLPAADKWIDPRYQGIEADDVLFLTSPDGGTLVRVIAGDVAEHHGPGSTHTPISLVHATLQPGAELVLPWPQDFNALVYVLSGRGTVGTRARPIHTGQLAVHGGGAALTLRADVSQESRHPALDVLVLGGRPIREPVYTHGPFVMNTRAEIIQAFEDFEAGKLGTVPADHIGHT